MEGAVVDRGTLVVSVSSRLCTYALIGKSSLMVYTLIEYHRISTRVTHEVYEMDRVAHAKV